MRTLTYLILYLVSNVLLAQSPLETEEWKSFFDERKYSEKAATITDENFWEIDRSFTYYETYPLLLVFSDGTSEILNWQYDGLPILLDKTKSLLDENFERVEKANIVYMVFEGFLLRNLDVGNMVAGDFAIVETEGPICVYREYYSSPITEDNVASGFRFFKDGEEIQNFYLGRFEKKASRMVADFPQLAKKIENVYIGYTKSDENIRRIVNEYNEWVKGLDPYRYDEWSGVNLQNF